MLWIVVSNAHIIPRRSKKPTCQSSTSLPWYTTVFELGLELETCETYGISALPLTVARTARKHWLAAFNSDYSSCYPCLCSSRYKPLLRAECRFFCNYSFTTPVCSWVDTRVDKWYILWVHNGTEMQFKINSSRTPLGTASEVVLCTRFSIDLTVWDNEFSLLKPRILYLCLLSLWINIASVSWGKFKNILFACFYFCFTSAFFF